MEPERVIGLSKWDLDTPALCVDLDKLEANIAKMQAHLAAHGLGCRPHAKTHKCAAIARLQLDAGAVGICTSKVSEAEALAAEGIDRICLTTSDPSRSKVRRAMALRARCPGSIQTVDEEHNARDLADAARVAEVVIGVAVAGFEARRERALANMEASARTLVAMRQAGLNTEIFSGGGTGTYNICHEVPGLTDVQVGSYVFMDMQYRAIGGRDGPVFTDFAHSLKVMATVLNNGFPGRLTTDAGAKALTLNVPRAGVVGEPGMDYDAGSDEFGVISFAEASQAYRIGDRLELIPPHCDPVVNLYDWIHGIRNDHVEVVWPVTARGCSQ